MLPHSVAGRAAKLGPVRTMSGDALASMLVEAADHLRDAAVPNRAAFEAREMLDARLKSALPDGARWAHSLARDGRRRGPVLGLSVWTDRTRQRELVCAVRPPVGMGGLHARSGADYDLIEWSTDSSLVVRNGACVPPRQQRELTARTLIGLPAEAERHPALYAEIVAPARFLTVGPSLYRSALVQAGELDLALGSGREPRPLVGPEGLREELEARAWDLVHHLRTAIEVPLEPAEFFEDDAKLGRAVGMMLGSLTGSALGSRVGPLSARELARLHPDGTRDLERASGWNTLLGQPSPSGELLVALTRALAKSSAWAPRDAATVYATWFESQPVDVPSAYGLPFGAAVLALGRGECPARAMARVARADARDNQALLRAPFHALLGHTHRGLGRRAVLEDTSLTHPHPVCLAASLALVAALQTGLEGEDADAMLQSALAATDTVPAGDAVRSVLRSAQRGEAPPRLDGSRGGFVLDSLHAGMWALRMGSDFEVALESVLMRGGSADVNGAIAGALLGARLGAHRIPARRRHEVTSCRPLARHAVHARPRCYWPVDIDVLCEQALLSARDLPDRPADVGCDLRLR